MASDPVPALPVSALAVLGVLVAVLVGGFLALVLSGKDTSTYTLFVAGPLVSSVIGVIINQRVAKVEQIAAVVKRQTDGQLTAQIDQLHTHLDAQTAEIVEAATAAPVSVPPVGSPGSGYIPSQPAPATSPAGALPPRR